MKATRDTDCIVVEILQVPLNKDLKPVDLRTSSQKRFLGYVNEGEIKDPALLQKDIRLTVIGEVKGMQGTMGNQASNEYPKLAILDMTAWYSSWP